MDEATKEKAIGMTLPATDSLGSFEVWKVADEPSTVMSVTRMADGKLCLTVFGEAYQAARDFWEILEGYVRETEQGKIELPTT